MGMPIDMRMGFPMGMRMGIPMGLEKIRAPLLEARAGTTIPPILHAGHYWRDLSRLQRPFCDAVMRAGIRGLNR